uniref:WLM domain-containing protein n=1 Tax=Salix viminalis TaxID=40686 RepID=A0A6N2K1Y1_SALVM
MDLNDLNKAWEIKPLKKAGEENARKALDKSSKTRTTHHGKTQMERGGAEAKLRSRRPNNEWHCFPYEQILDTMSHELCHNKNVGS